MTVETDNLQGVHEQPRPPIPQEAIEPTQEELGNIVSDLLPQALEILDPYVSSWAGEDWKEKGLPTNGVYQRNKPKDFNITYFGSKAQGGPTQLLSIRMESGEGIFFQRANPESRSAACQRHNYIYWDGKSASMDPSLGKQFLESLRKKD